MSDSKNFSIGDLVSVAGGSIGKDENVSNSAEVCLVAAVGLTDLIVEKTSLQGSYRVSKDLCNIIKIEPSKLSSSKITHPEIGDLVTSFQRKYYSNEEPKRMSGVLYKITYRLGAPETCTLLCGTDFEEAPYNSIIVVQKK